MATIWLTVQLAFHATIHAEHAKMKPIHATLVRPDTTMLVPRSATNVTRTASRALVFQATAHRALMDITTMQLATRARNAIRHAASAPDLKKATALTALKDSMKIGMAIAQRAMTHARHAHHQALILALNALMAIIRRTTHITTHASQFLLDARTTVSERAAFIAMTDTC